MAGNSRAIRKRAPSGVAMPEGVHGGAGWVMAWKDTTLSILRVAGSEGKFRKPPCGCVDVPYPSHASWWRAGPDHDSAFPPRCAMRPPLQPLRPSAAERMTSSIRARNRGSSIAPPAVRRTSPTGTRHQSPSARYASETALFRARCSASRHVSADGPGSSILAARDFAKAYTAISASGPPRNASSMIPHAVPTLPSPSPPASRRHCRSDALSANITANRPSLASYRTRDGASSSMPPFHPVPAMSRSTALP